MTKTLVEERRDRKWRNFIIYMTGLGFRKISFFFVFFYYFLNSPCKWLPNNSFDDFDGLFYCIHQNQGIFMRIKR